MLSLLLPICLLKQLRRSGIDQYQRNLLDTKLVECLRLILEPYLLISLTVGVLQEERPLDPSAWFSLANFLENLLPCFPT